MLEQILELSTHFRPIVNFISMRQKPNYSGFVLIGAGLPRTGTNSTRGALFHLLDGACYHMVDCQQGMTREANFWIKATKGNVSKEEWVHMLEGRGYRAGVDYPVALFYK